MANDPDLPVGATKTSVNLSQNYWVNSPYPSTYVSRVFNVGWEAALPGTTRSSGTLRSPTDVGTPAGELDDVGADFCAKGVLAGDLVVLPGCTADTDCVPQDSFSCHQPIGGAMGLCLSKTAPQTDVDKCTRFMGSRRRYEIIAAGPTQLKLGLHLDEVPKTVLNRVAATETGDDTECQPPAHPQGNGEASGIPVATGAAGRKLQALREGLWPLFGGRGDTAGCRSGLPPGFCVRNCPRLARPPLA